MGLDVRANLIVGVPFDDVYQESIETIDITKTDKNGISYTVEEKRPVFTFLGKLYIESEYNLHGLLEEIGLQEVNGKIIGFLILTTDSHTHSDQATEIYQEDLERNINRAMKKLESLGLSGKIYLIQDMSW